MEGERKGRLPFRHLTWTDRLRIEKMLKEGHTSQEIADTLRVNVSTINREKKRGETVQMDSELRTKVVYTADRAHAKYRENMKAKGPELKIGNDRELADYLEKKIRDDKYSPEAALAAAKEEGKMEETSISKWTLYSYIRKGVFLSLTMADLPQGGKTKVKHKKVKRGKRAPAGDSIEQRPAEVATRETFGHWEMDTVVSAKDTSLKRLLVLSERKTRQELVVLMNNGEAESVVAAINQIEEKLGPESFRKIFRTITVDNGVEFADCAGIEGGTGENRRTHVFYCHPYRSSERGLNENSNRLIRRHWPKGTSFEAVTEEQVQEVEDWINNYPRGVLAHDCSRKRFEAELLTIGARWFDAA